MAKSNRRAPSSMLSNPKYRIFCFVSLIIRGFIILDVMALGGRNREIAETWKYHNATKHSDRSIRASPHYLDWSNQPLPLKIYTTIDPIPLPRDADQTGVAALSAIAAADVSAGTESIPGLRDLARILYFSAGIVKKKTF